MLEVKEGLEEEEEVGLVVVDEDVALVALDVAALEEALEEDELAAGVEEPDGGAVACGVDVATA